MAGGKKIRVAELEAECLKVAASPANGHRATVAVKVQVVGPDGVRYRGGGTRLHLEVEPVGGGGAAKAKKTTKKRAKKKARG